MATKLGYCLLLKEWVRPLLKILGLPVETTRGFILGFLRRDYGAVSIFKALEETGKQRYRPQAVISFADGDYSIYPMSCQFFVMIKEQGVKNAF